MKNDKHKIEIARIGKLEEETFVILIDGREIDDKTDHAKAMTIADWLRRNMSQLEGIL